MRPVDALICLRKLPLLCVMSAPELERERCRLGGIDTAAQELPRRSQTETIAVGDPAAAADHVRERIDRGRDLIQGADVDQIRCCPLASAIASTSSRQPASITTSADVG